ncbi:MAG: hypothetical protein HYS60_01215 [Candidatus Wildermuthbacteria bacterium]|nr:hypothetical protein [Candidatus Wildermuthbacteria bacterium]
MIIRIDHVSLSCADFSRATQDLARFGYRKQFEEDAVKNVQIKKPLLHRWSENHDLALFSSDSGISIELLNHHGIQDAAPSFFTPIIRGADEEMTKSKNAVNIGKQRGVLTTMGSFDCIVLEGKKRPFVLQELALHAENLDESESFWSCFGFQRVLAEDDCRMLKFASPFQASPCVLYLLQSAGPMRKTKLDDAGFASIAFISNNVGEERDFLDKRHVHPSAVEQLNVHGKTFSICFAQGSQGEIVELLSLQ